MCAEQPIQGRSPTVLLVEDDPAVARMLRIFLRASGFDIKDAALGAEALRVLEHESPDAVILDLMLPNGQGEAVLNRLRRPDQHSAPAWVAISSLDRSEATTRYGALGYHFLGKPFDPRVLLAMLSPALPEGHSRDRASGGPTLRDATIAKCDQPSSKARSRRRRGGRGT